MFESSNGAKRVEWKGAEIRKPDLHGESSDGLTKSPILRSTSSAVGSSIAASMSRCRIMALIPAYNEERFIGSVVLQAAKYADTVLVVDDGSTDATAEVAQSAGAMVLQHRRNEGKGVALNTGFEKARELFPDAVVVIDADGQHVPDDILTLVTPIFEQRADIVVGSRYLQPTSRVPGVRVFGHWIFNLMTNRVSGISLSDSQSGFRAFSQRALGAISFSSRGFSVESEMQLLAREHNLTMIEMPITIKYLDKPKRSVVAHGLMVLNGMLHLVGQYRPLLSFGLLGLPSLLIGLMFGKWVVDIYRSEQALAMEYALISLLLTVFGIMSILTGMILHSVRGLLLDLVRPKMTGGGSSGTGK